MPISANRGFVVVSDTHISVRSDPLDVKRFCDFLGSVAGQGTAACGAVVIAGDLFNLDLLDSATGSVEGSKAGDRLAGILAKFPDVGRAIARLLVEGINVTILAGNHDVELLDPDVADTFRRAVQLQVEKEAGPAVGRLDLPSRTILRLEAVHIEHGNRFDRDNCFDEPSLDSVRNGSKPLFPLGSCMERRFASRMPQLDYSGFSSCTPWPLLRAVLCRHGVPGGLTIVARYYVTAFGLLAESWRRRRITGARGQSRIPTLNSPLRTFHRLYLDRSIAFCAAVLWVLLMPFGLRSSKPLWLVGSGCVALALSASLVGGNRYRAAVATACRQGAHEVTEDPSVATVIMGHSHEAVESVIDESGRRYLNSGAFVAPASEGCPYVFVTPTERETRAELRHYLSPEVGIRSAISNSGARHQKPSTAWKDGLV